MPYLFFLSIIFYMHLYYLLYHIIFVVIYKVDDAIL